MNKMSRKDKIKMVVTMGMLCALAYIVMSVGKIPVVLFLKYEPKDVIIALGAFIYGPVAGAIISVIVSAIEMISVSDTGIIGFLMNVISTCAFVCPAAIIYKKMHNMRGAIVGLIVGVVFMTGLMILWNYIITPFYMHLPREEVAKLLVPAFLPFNLIKGCINAALTILLYKPVVKGLRKARLLPEVKAATGKGKINPGMMLAAAIVLITGILLILVLRGLI